jgi:DHA2 family multidrug resistance protein
VHHAQLTEQVTAFSPATSQYLAQLPSGGDPTAALAAIDRTIGAQAYAMATVDLSYVAGWIFLMLIPLLWLARPPFGSTAGAAAE